MTKKGTSTNLGAWDYVCCLLLSLLRLEQKLPAQLAFSAAPDLFEKL
jgi:hypothetical protein